MLCRRDEADRAAILVAGQGLAWRNSWTRHGNARWNFSTHGYDLRRAQISLLPVCGEKVAVAAG